MQAGAGSDTRRDAPCMCAAAAAGYPGRRLSLTPTNLARGGRAHRRIASQCHNKCAPRSSWERIALRAGPRGGAERRPLRPREGTRGHGTSKAEGTISTWELPRTSVSAMRMFPALTHASQPLARHVFSLANNTERSILSSQPPTSPQRAEEPHPRLPLLIRISERHLHTSSRRANRCAAPLPAARLDLQKLASTHPAATLAVTSASRDGSSVPCTVASSVIRRSDT